MDIKNQAISSLLGGLLTLILVFILKKREKAILNDCTETEAFLIDNEIEYGQNSSLYYPVVKFMLQNKEWVTAKYSEGYYPPKKIDHQKLTVLYSNSDYTKFIIKEYKSPLKTIFVIAGVCLIFYTLYLYYKIYFKELL